MIRAPCRAVLHDAVRIADLSTLEVSASGMPLRELSIGFFNPTGAIFVVTTFSFSDGKLPWGTA